MTSRERVFAYLRGDPVDRIPNLSIIKAFAARRAGIPYGRYCTDYRSLVEAYLPACERFGIDTTNVMSDPFREASDFGSAVEFSESEMLKCRLPFIRTREDIAKLKPYDPLTAARAVNTCKAIELFRQTAGDRLVICGIVEMPFSEAVTLRGMESIMIDLYDDPSFLRAMMDIILETMKEYVKAQIRAGADIVDIDWMVDAGRALGTFGDKVFVSGNMDPVSLYRAGTPELVRKKVFELAEKNRGRLCISSGCEIPMFAPEQNVLAHRQALEEIGGR